MTGTPKNGTVISAAFILGASSLASKVVGLIQKRVFTTTFGAGDTYDAFLAAFRIPDLIFNLIVIGALSAAFIPLFTDKVVKGKQKREQAFAFALSVLNALLIVMAALMVLFALFAHGIVPIITPGFSGEKLELTISLSRVMALQPILLTISFVFSGILNSFKRFVVYALAPILYNVGIIFGVVVFVPMVGIVGLAWGVVLGAALHMAIQLPSALREGFRWRPLLEWASADVRAVWRMLLPRVFGLAAQQINLLIVTIIGSTLLAGSITVFDLANNVQYLPIGIFGLAFAQAAFPTLAEQVSRRQNREFLTTLTRTFRYILFFVIPVSVFFFLLRAQIIRVLFGDGAFDWEDTILTFETFGWLTISIFAQATIPLLTRAFYVRQNTMTPVIISSISILVNVLLAVLLAPRMGVQGLALAFSASAILHMALLLAAIRYRLRGFGGRHVVGGVVRLTLAAALAGVVVQLLKYPIANIVDMQRFWGVASQLILTGTAGVAVYVGLCWMFGSEELTALRKYVPRRLLPAPEAESYGELLE